MDRLSDFLEHYPELALYLAIGLGYLIGQLQLGPVSLGPVTGSLFAGLLIGQLAEVPVSAMAKSFLFLLFLFGIGYSVGPQFLGAIRRDGVNSVALALVVAAVGLATSYAVATILGLDAGFAAGLLSGGLTQSAAIGTATEAINGLPLPEAERATLVAHVAVADALCYVFGSVGAIWFCSVLGPRLIGVDLVEAAAELEERIGYRREQPGIVSAYRRFELRAVRVKPAAAIVGRTVAQTQAEVAPDRLFILRLRRGDTILEAGPDLVIAAGDVIAVSGRREQLLRALDGAEETDDHDLLDLPFLVVEMLVSKRDLVGSTLENAARQDWSQGIYVRSVRRGAVELPIRAGLVIERGDVLHVVGPAPAIKRAATHVGPIIAPSSATDFVVLGFAIVLGGVAGVLARLPVGDASLSLGTSVGVLLAGLVVGHLRTRHVLFGRIPDGAVALMTSLGLAAFVAMTGLHAGPVFVPALLEAGVGLLLGGVVVTLLPLTVGLYFGCYVLRMHPVLLLGGIAGAQTVTAAMAAVQTRSGSPVAVLGYTPTYPVAQVLLTLWGTVIVLLVSG